MADTTTSKWQCFVMSPPGEPSEGCGTDLCDEQLLQHLCRSSQRQAASVPPVCRELASASFEVEGESNQSWRRVGSVTFVPPLSALWGCCSLSPCGPAYQLVDAAGCVFDSGVIESDRLARGARPGVLDGLFLTGLPRRADRNESRRLPLSVRPADDKDWDCCPSVCGDETTALVHTSEHFPQVSLSFQTQTAIFQKLPLTCVSDMTNQMSDRRLKELFWLLIYWLIDAVWQP